MIGDMETNIRNRDEVSVIGISHIVVLFAFVAALLFLESNERVPLLSVETQFIEESKNGLGIIPASCASHPSYYHYHLFAALGGNTRAFSSNNGQVEYGGMVGTTPLCVTNVSGYNYYIPANTAAELNTFRARGLPGVSVW